MLVTTFYYEQLGSQTFLNRDEIKILNFVMWCVKVHYTVYTFNQILLKNFRVMQI